MAGGLPLTDVSNEACQAPHWRFRLEAGRPTKVEIGMACGLLPPQDQDGAVLAKEPLYGAL